MSAGGRELRIGNKRTAPQTRDQPLNNNNSSLIQSHENHTPVRVRLTCLLNRSILLNLYLYL
jgi:hypothetical protein